MATNKVPPKTPAPKTTAIVPWMKEMEEAAKAGANREKLSGGFKSISTQGGRLMVDETPVPNNEMRIIVVASIYENQLYDGPYDPKNPAPPVCYAFGDPNADDPEDGMAPHEKAENPQGDDHGLCASCEYNKMGSADTGRGKACKNIRRLGVITEDALEDPAKLAAAEVRKLNVPVMSTKFWAKYVHSLAEDMSRTPYAVITKVSLVPDPKSQFTVQFAFEELITFDAALWGAMKKKVAEVQELLAQPYPSAEEVAANAAAAKAKTPARKVVPIKPSGPAAKTPVRVPVKGAAVPAKAAAGATRKAKY